MIIEEEEPVPPVDGIPVPPAAAQKSSENWDYFNLFDTDHVPAPSLGQPEVSMVDKQGSKSVKVESGPVASGRDQAPPVIPDKGFVEPGLVQQQKTMRRQRMSGGSSLHHRAVSVGGGSESKRGKMVANAAQSVNLLMVLKKLDDYFLRAYENANEVSKMLAAPRLHYHFNFADNRGDLLLRCNCSFMFC